MPYKPRRRRFARKGKKAATKRSYLQPKKNFVRAVKRIISNIAEDKVVTTYGLNNQIAYAGSITDPTYISLLPAIVQGVEADQRTGNQCRLKSSIIRGYVNLNSLSAFSTSCVPLYCKMWVCRRKAQNFYDTINSADWDNFFQAGQTVLGLQGNMLDTLLYPNNDYWTVTKTKTFILAPNSNLPATTAVGTALTQYPTSQGAISVPFKFDVTKELGGTLKFNDNTFRPQNKELYLVFQVVPMDGSTPATLGLSAEFQYVLEHKFEDM